MSDSEEEHEDTHNHPMGWLQIVIYIMLISALFVGIGFILKNL